MKTCPGRLLAAHTGIDNRALNRLCSAGGRHVREDGRDNATLKPEIRAAALRMALIAGTGKLNLDKAWRQGQPPGKAQAKRQTGPTT